MPNKVVRAVKMALFSILGIYASITMFLAAANTFGKAPNFATVKPTDRCISWFDTAESFAKENNNTLIAYALNAGRYRFGFCTDLSNEVLDAKFGESLLFDPLKDATDGKCSLDDASLTNERETQCTITGMPSGTTCTQVLNTIPVPYGVAWKFQITSINNISNRPPLPPAPPGVTVTPTPTSGDLKCAANYKKDDDMPSCPYSNVRFYGKENKAISLIFILASLSAIGLWIWEIVNVVQFSNYHGDRYGDLETLVCPNDGTWGALYTFYRVYISSEPMPGDDPEMSWFQFFRSAMNQILAQLVALIGIVGCNLNEHLVMLALFLLTTLKLLFTLLKKAYTIAKPPAPTAQEILDNAGEVPYPPSIDPNLNGIVADCVRRGTDKEYINQVIPRLENSPSKNLYKKCLSKLLIAGPSCINSEIGRLTVICQRATTDPAIYNECITWIQLLEQCQNFAAGGAGTYGPPRFPNWRSKVAPELAAAHAAVARGDGDEKIDDEKLAMSVAGGSPTNNLSTPMLQMPPQPQPQQVQQQLPPAPIPPPQQQFSANPAAGSSPPSMVFADFQPVVLNPQMMITFATYGPANLPNGQGNNVTQQLQQLSTQYQGNAIQGGIHTILGDVAPGVAKQLRVWYQQQQQQMPMMNNNNNNVVMMPGSELL